MTDKITPDLVQWLTIIPSRSPVQKLHLTLSGAKNSFNSGYRGHRKGGELFELVGGEWVLKWTLKSGYTDAPWTI